jgi:hypothetical protein
LIPDAPSSASDSMIIPTIDEIDRIARLGDPILGNLQITQCYYEISQSVTLSNNASQGEAFFSVYRGAFPYWFLTKPFSRSSPRTTGEKTRFPIPA